MLPLTKVAVPIGFDHAPAAAVVVTAFVLTLIIAAALPLGVPKPKIEISTDVSLV
jgi:hypothetical protein